MTRPATLEPGSVVVARGQRDCDRLATVQLTAIGSDQYAVIGHDAHVHPRSWGTARILGHYVRQRHVLDLETAIHEMTGLPATVFGLRDRGLIREGYSADLVLFDPLAVEDLATSAEPNQRVGSIETVLLGCRFAVKAGEIADARLGRVLRRGEGISHS